jgi:hypothetical protein
MSARPPFTLRKGDPADMAGVDKSSPEAPKDLYKEAKPTLR